MDVVLESKKVTKLLAIFILCLVLAHLAGQISKFYFGHGRLFGFVRMFDLDSERSIPTLYSSVSLLSCSALLALISYYKRKQLAHNHYHWAGLAAIFLFLSIDEMVSLHERLIVPVGNILNISGSGYLHFAWVIPYGICLIIFLLAYSKFIFGLPKRTRILFIIAGMIYIIGAIGFECCGSKHVSLYGRDNFSYTLIIAIEETLEMLGILVFIYALISYIGSEITNLTVRIT
jgi:hypothetical protein